MPSVEQQYTQEQIDDALIALIGYAGNVNAAIRHLKQAGKRAPANVTLSRWAQITHWERYEELRARYSSALETKQANDLLDTMRRANEGTNLAIEQAIKRLEAGKDDDPARTAANLARVQQSSVDKRMTLTGRPKEYTESRDATQILRGLVAKHPQIFGLTPEPEQIEAAEASEHDA